AVATEFERRGLREGGEEEERNATKPHPKRVYRKSRAEATRRAPAGMSGGDLEGSRSRRKGARDGPGTLPVRRSRVRGVRAARLRDALSLLDLPEVPRHAVRDARRRPARPAPMDHGPRARPEIPVVRR